MDGDGLKKRTYETNDKPGIHTPGSPYRIDVHDCSGCLSLHSDIIERLSSFILKLKVLALCEKLFPHITLR